MRADTDDDGLSDSREVVLSTNLDGTDTDGDGIPDGREPRHWDTDPTLHDHRPPEITIHYARWAVDGLHSEYAILYAVTDPSGDSEIQFVKEGDVR
ncbi:hypothetical protein [Halorarum salinum]|uniref:Calcium-binding protein n=1 Tax=Halorarum salinum TaxID=2743089 RepID=A0A7D5L7U0_9EURY|nr:hypothetical protein [Halobaculum salinum]QLG60266.1 hypothetical protein HUG12_00185 [Halobaculum salinum]